MPWDEYIDTKTVSAWIFLYHVTAATENGIESINVRTRGVNLYTLFHILVRKMSLPLLLILYPGTVSDFYNNTTDIVAGMNNFNRKLEIDLTWASSLLIRAFALVVWLSLWVGRSSVIFVSVA